MITLNSVLHQLARNWAIFQVRVIEVMIFRWRALVWFLAGSINTAILLLFWWALLNAQSGSIQGFSLSSITSYYLLMLTFGTVTVCHIEEEISVRDINKGTLYGYLLRPYPYLLAKFHEEIVWRLLGGFWALCTIGVLVLFGFNLAISTNPAIWLVTVLSAILGTLVSFFYKTILGFTSFWLTNIRGITDLSEILSIVLSGFILPLSLFPAAVQNLALLTPFAMSTYYPVTILTTAPPTAEIFHMLAIQLAWVLVLGTSSLAIFRRGVKHYTGVSQ